MATKLEGLFSLCKQFTSFQVLQTYEALHYISQSTFLGELGPFGWPFCKALA